MLSTDNLCYCALLLNITRYQLIWKSFYPLMDLAKTERDGLFDECHLSQILDYLIRYPQHESSKISIRLLWISEIQCREFTAENIDHPTAVDKPQTCGHHAVGSDLVARSRCDSYVIHSLTIAHMYVNVCIYRHQEYPWSSFLSLALI